MAVQIADAVHDRGPIEPSTTPAGRSLVTFLTCACTRLQPGVNSYAKVMGLPSPTSDASPETGPYLTRLQVTNPESSSRRVNVCETIR